MPLTAKDRVSQNASNAPLSSTFTDMSHLEVAAPYRPKQATEITPARHPAGDICAGFHFRLAGYLNKEAALINQTRCDALIRHREQMRDYSVQCAASILQYCRGVRMRQALSPKRTRDAGGPVGGV